MTEDIFTIFGYIGSANACFMMVPQIMLTIKKKTMDDISIQYISFNLLTQFLFLPYSVYFKLYPFLTVNIFLAFYDLWLIYLYYFNLKQTANKDLEDNTNVYNNLLDDA